MIKAYPPCPNAPPRLPRYRDAARASSEMADTVLHAGMTWAIDEFLGENQSLLVAEVELDAEDQSFELPAWAGQEVSDDPRYFNVNLVRHPYSRWDTAQSPHAT